LEFVGGSGEGVFCNGVRFDSRHMATGSLDLVLASRSEFERGQWHEVAAAGLEVVPMGSVAYKIARVAAGLDPLTWTPEPKHEWDIAGGAALISAGGGCLLDLDGREITFNQPHPWVNGAIAIPRRLRDRQQEIRDLVALSRTR
jgi:myo-inositol-1(or 4)-monophosphatase